MAVLGFLVAAAGAILVWYWRLRMARTAVQEVSEIAGDVKAAIRRFGFSTARGQHPAETVSDPRLAATAVMVAAAKLDGALTRGQLDGLDIEIREAFQVDGREAADMLAIGRWVSDQSLDPDDTIRRLAPLIRDQAPVEAHEDLLARMARVAALEGGEVSDAQNQSIALLRDRLGLNRRH